MDKISVMICDDSALMRNLIGRIISDYDGLEVVGKAENGQDLLDKIPVYKPDVILLDIEMPVMTGVQFLEKRKQLHIDIPVIIPQGGKKIRPISRPTKVPRAAAREPPVFFVTHEGTT